MNISDIQREIVNECKQKKCFGLSIRLGSGKTIISLTAALETKTDEPILIIASKTLIPSWIREIKKFYGNTISYSIINNNYRPNTDLVLCTPDIAGRYFKKHNLQERFVFQEEFNPFELQILAQHNERAMYTLKNVYRLPKQPMIPVSTSEDTVLFSKSWSTLIVDEAHDYTNIETQSCRAICCIISKQRYLLSGTLFDEPSPERILGYYLMINHPSFPVDIPSTINFIRDPLFKGVGRTIITREIEPVKIKVIKQFVEHDLSDEEAKIYLSLKETLNIIRKKASMLSREQKKKFNSYILSMITILRQSIVVPLIPVANIALQMSEITDHKSELALILHEQFKNLDIDYFLDNPDSLKSTRITKLLEILKKHKDNKIIIFSCFRTSIDVVVHYLKKETEFEVYDLKASTTMKKRSQILENFSESINGSILITTYDIGACGLNLQAANVVILMDYWWNSSKSKQAIGRIVRQGQMNNEVYVYLFSSNTGIENAIFNKQKDKLDILEELQDGPITKKIKKMSINELLKLIDTSENSKYLSIY